MGAKSVIRDASEDEDDLTERNKQQRRKGGSKKGKVVIDISDDGTLTKKTARPGNKSELQRNGKSHSQQMMER